MAESRWHLWGYTRDYDLESHGLVVIDSQEDYFDVDSDFAKIFGEEAVPMDDNWSPWVFVGVVETAGQMRVVCSASHNLSIGHDHDYLHSTVVTSAIADQVRGWYEVHRSAKTQKVAKATRRDEVLREHGLDEETIARRREEVLRKHGLL